MKRLRDHWAKYGDDWSYWRLKALNHQPPTGPFSYFLGTLRSFLSVGYPGGGGGMKAQREGPRCFHFEFSSVHNIDTPFGNMTFLVGLLFLFLIDIWFAVVKGNFKAEMNIYYYSYSHVMLFHFVSIPNNPADPRMYSEQICICQNSLIL